MRNPRRITVSAVSAVIAVCASTPAYAASPHAAVPVTQGWITHVGGVNVVPTPAGLGLDLSASTEVLLAGCGIRDGCASRAWQVDTPGQSRRWFLANVAYEPTTLLAHRFLLARAHTYQVMSAFSGTVNHTKGRHQRDRCDQWHLRLFTFSPGHDARRPKDGARADPHAWWGSASQ